jgi:DNA-binding NtrC family response regulator
VSQATKTFVMAARGGLKEVRFPRLRLEVVRGPDQRRQKTFRVDRLTIGSADGAGFQLSDPTVSACHCALELTPEGCQVTDLGAKNGVRLFGRRVQQAYLEPGDVLELGASAVRLKLESEVETHPISERTSLGSLRGGSIPMRLLYDQILKVAAAEVPVLVTGETGTGKELVAEAIVAASPRATGPFVVIDCTRHGTDLFESELFGHVKGAFTGAERDAAGGFERAHGGTVLLDNVCELPAALQPKLLGVLERRQVQPLGGTPRAVDVRVLATSRLELEREINRGTFRADLFYRLAAVQLSVPPLRDRREDIPGLVAELCRELSLDKPLPAYVLEQLYAADYPGNVRELKSAVARAAFGVAPQAHAAEGARLDAAGPYWPQRERLLAALERRYVAELMAACGDNVSEAARRSGISRVQLYAMLHRHGLAAPRKR